MITITNAPSLWAIRMAVLEGETDVSMYPSIWKPTG